MDIAYQVKESKSKDRLIADRILSAQNSGILKCTLCSDTLINRQIGILSSFDVPYSNRFTKGCNNNIKVIKTTIMTTYF